MSTELLGIKERKLIISEMAETLIGSEIINLAWQINELIANGKNISNLTIGDFDPKIYPIPELLKEEIKKAYDENQTNYPPANGTFELRKEVSGFIKKRGGLNYNADEIMITSGARPVIFAAYNTLVDLDDVIIFPVPSWNNNHYTHLTRSRAIMIETKPEHNFMPTADDIAPHISKASLISLCSPLNPTGTVFSRKEISDICDLIVEENNRRGDDEKPVYLLFDQIYWLLTHGDTEHYNPVILNPDIRNYTVFVDGISKAFCGTGVRVGWAYGPKKLISKMNSITSHMGAWAPKAEQIAISRYLKNDAEVDKFLNSVKKKISDSMHGFYDGFKDLKNKGYDVDVIAPQASIFLTVKINLTGRKTLNGKLIRNTKDTSDFLIDEAGIAFVPFASFGASQDSKWYRISVGTITSDEVKTIMKKLEKAFSTLS